MKRKEIKRKMKVVYYTDELSDDFAGAHIEADKLGQYKFRHGVIWKFIGGILYRFVATPISRLFNVILYGERIKNKKVIRKYLKKGCYIYGNHTMSAADAFTPTAVTFPKKAYILVGPAAVKIPVLKTFVEMFGGVPIPTEYVGMKAFTEYLGELGETDKCVFVYPEAHIWPYYTGVRKFKDLSFTYPIVNDKPVFTATKTFHKRLIGKLPKVVTYIDGPFFADKTLSVKSSRQKLSEEVYETIKKRCELSDYEFVKYIKKEPDDIVVPKENIA